MTNAASEIDASRGAKFAHLLREPLDIFARSKPDDFHAVGNVAGDFQGALADTPGGAKDDDATLSHKD